MFGSARRAYACRLASKSRRCCVFRNPGVAPTFPVGWLHLGYFSSVVGGIALISPVV